MARLCRPRASRPLELGHAKSNPPPTAKDLQLLEVPAPALRAVVVRDIRMRLSQELSVLSDWLQCCDGSENKMSNSECGVQSSFESSCNLVYTQNPPWSAMLCSFYTIRVSRYVYIFQSLNQAQTLKSTCVQLYLLFYPIRKYSVLKPPHQLIRLLRKSQGEYGMWQYPR